MFKFGFDLDLEDEVEDFGGIEPAPLTEATAAAQDEVVPSAPFREIAFDDLSATLPPSLSYCPLPLPSHVPSTVAPIVRRDMFDAQFQLIASATGEDEAEGASSVTGKSWGPETDLVKGVYEGGMKTWECAGDLVGVLGRDVVKEQGWRAIEGKKIMEVGCGTAIPSAYLLQELLAKPEDACSEAPPRTTFYLLDYNEIVLQLVTLPNLLLTFRHLLTSPTPPGGYEAVTNAAAPAKAVSTADPTARRSASPAPSSAEGENSDDDDSAADEDASLTLGSSRLKRFRELLARRNISLRFFSGGWDSFALADADGGEAKMDVVLTSETVYQATNLPSLVALLRRVSHPSSSEDAQGTTTLTLVAAKVLYFGLEGGGVPAFEGAVEAGGGGGWTEEVWRSASGVKRWVGRVGWSS